MLISDLELYSRLIKGELICVPKEAHKLFKRHLLINFKEHVIVHKGDWFIEKKDELAVAELQLIELIIELSKKQRKVLDSLSKYPLGQKHQPKLKIIV